MRNLYFIILMLVSGGVSMAQSSNGQSNNNSPSTLKANDADVLHITGNETKAGNLTLSNKLILDSLKLGSQGILNLGNFNSTKGMRFYAPLTGLGSGNQIDFQMTSNGGSSWQRAVSFGSSLTQFDTDITITSGFKLNGNTIPTGSNDSLVLKSEYKTNNATNVHIAGNETVAGVKSFTSSPLVPNATNNNHPTTLQQLNTGLDLKADKTITVNGQALSGNVTLVKSDVGLGNADNTNDLDKPLSTAAIDALNLKADKSITVNGQSIGSNVVLVKSDVGLGNADNTSDADKPLSTATTSALSLKADKAITVNGQSIGSNVVLIKSDVGLGNVDNTSDINKPLSTTATDALNLKADKAITVNGQSIGSNVVLVKSDVGLGNADNTSDVDKPLSTATTSALSLKADKAITVNGQSLGSNVVLAKSDVGLGNADNTSDADKPLSIVATSALSLKADKAITVNGQSIGSNVVLVKSDVGLGNADNTSDADKPLSTATTSALSLKADKATTLAGYGITDAVLNINVVHNTGDEIIAGTKSFSGNVGIGTNKPDSKLTVAGTIHAQEVKVSVNAGADFVFEKDYKLKPLTELANYLSANKHLPEIASANEMKKNGLNLSEMNIKLLQKVEELTLYVIEQHKKLEEQQKQLQLQNKRILSLEQNTK